MTTNTTMGSTNPPKRPLPSDSLTPDSDPKRVRSNNGSPAPPPALSDLERKKQEASARIAAVKAKLAAQKAGAAPLPSSTSTSTPPPPPPSTPAPSAQDALSMEAKKAAAQKKIAEMKAKMLAQRQQQQQTTQPPTDAQQRLAEARVKATALASQRTNSPIPPPPRQSQDPSTQRPGGRGGLGIGLHPSLIGDTTSTPPLTRRGEASAKAASLALQNQRVSTLKPTEADRQKSNPYLTPISTDDPSTKPDEATTDPTLVTRKPTRTSRQLQFNTKGKFIAQANALRQQARLEEMKARIAAETKTKEIEEASDKSFLVPAPPEHEWWDEALLPLLTTTPISDNEIITALIQHPIILSPPQDKFAPAPKPLMLTPTEQKKLRRQRRMADMKEQQAKIRLGLLEPPPPKVKKSNMMRVLGEQAVKDPTAVENRVNKEIAQRLADHERMNAERALTPEQRREKLKQQQAGDERRGVRVAVFRVGSLASGKHRYQVDVNAKQHGLTGIVVLHPETNLIIVEGGVHSITAYKKLMLQRIKWTENTLPLSNAAGPSTFTGGNDGTSKATAASTSNSSGNPNTAGAGTDNKAAAWLTPLDERGELRDLGGNSCELVFEGEEVARRFKKWGSRAVVTDGEAREVLRRGGGMENFWGLGRGVGGGRD